MANEEDDNTFNTAGGSLFIGRLAFDCRTRELEDLFGKYGRLTRCDVKKGYAFVEYEDERDAADAIKYLDGTRFLGMNISVERTRSERKPPVNPDGSRNRDCFKCGLTGHYARDCNRRSYRKDDDYRNDDNHNSDYRNHINHLNYGNHGNRRNYNPRSNRSKSPEYKRGRIFSPSPEDYKSRNKSPRSKSPIPPRRDH